VLDDVGRFEPTGTWGTDMTRRLIVGIDGVDRADRAYLDQVQSESDAYDEMNRAVEDLNAPFC
jgi:hypothetical protein